MSRTPLLPLAAAIAAKNKDAIRSLLSSPDARDNVLLAYEGRDTALMAAVRLGQIPLVQLLVDRFGADINDVDPKHSDRVALGIAIKRSDKAMVEWLIQHGADVNAFTTPYRSALALAQDIGDAQIISLLVNNGAISTTPLLEAIKKGDYQQAKWYIERRIDINTPTADGHTPLMLAAMNDQFNTTYDLIQAGADVNAVGTNGNTAMILAASKDHRMIVGLLIQAGADKDKTNDNGRTALIEAAARGNVDAALRLIEAGANRSIADKDGHTAYSLSVGKYPDIVRLLPKPEPVHQTVVRQSVPPSVSSSVHSSVHSSVPSSVPSNVPSSVPPSVSSSVPPSVPPPPKYDIESLYTAIRMGNIGNLKTALDNGVSPNPPAVKPEYGIRPSPLFEAVRVGRLDMVKMLVKAGANVNATDAHNTTALAMALNGRLFDIFAYLLDHGANPNIVNDMEYTVAVEALSILSLSDYKHLLDDGVDPNVLARNSRAPSDPEQPLLFHVLDNMELLQYLLNGGADPNVVDARDESLLRRAYDKGYYDQVRFLVQRDAHLNQPMESSFAPKIAELMATPPIDATDNKGRTALMRAIRDHDSNSVQSLLQQGANVNTFDKDNETPLTMALENVWVPREEREKLVKILLDAGAYTNPYNMAQYDVGANRGSIERILKHPVDIAMRKDMYGTALTLLRAGARLPRAVHMNSINDMITIRLRGPDYHELFKYLEDAGVQMINPVLY